LKFRTGQAAKNRVVSCRVASCKALHTTCIDLSAEIRRLPEYASFFSFKNHSQTPHTQNETVIFQQILHLKTSPVDIQISKFNSQNR